MSRNTKKRKSRKNNRSKLTQPGMILILVGGLFLVGLAFFLFPREKLDPNYVPEVTGGASLKVDKESIDFGDVKINKTVEATFTLTNVGDRTLEFSKDPFIEVKEGC